QNNVLIIRPKGGDDAQPPIALSSTTGLIQVSKTEKGVAGRALLIAGIEPGRKIEIFSERLTAVVGQGPPVPQVFVVTKTTVSGDTHGTEWFIDFEAMPEGATIDLTAAA
ncbi:unnamed protein product, partial [marine sediment metagenome]